MENKPAGTRIVFLSANAGTGHDMAANAIAGILKEMDPSVSCQVVNSYRFIKQPYRTLMEEGYIPFIRLMPRLYRFLYERKHQKSSILNLKAWLNRTTAPNFMQFLGEEKPDLIVCTHAFPCGVLAEMKRKGLLKTTLTGVVTDFVVNPFWIYPETDMYMIASGDLMDTFTGRGVAPERVKITGIPINPRFNGRGLKKDEARRKLGLDPDRPVLMVMGGGLGMSPATRSLITLSHISTPLEAVIVMGKNDRDRARMERSLERMAPMPHRVTILGYVDNIHEYMKAADLLLTKPGGMTTSEATAAGLPMLLTDPLPGQENNNVQYLLHRGLAAVINRERDIPGAVEKMLLNRETLGEMSRRALQLAVPDSANRAAEYILSLVRG